MSTLVDGRGIADSVARALRERATRLRPTLAIISVAPDFATQKYLSIKERQAAALGIALTRVELADSATTEDVIRSIEHAHDADGIVLQLPFPLHIDVADALAALPLTQDVDMIGAEANAAFSKNEARIMPPVVAAIEEITRRHSVLWQDAQVTVVGKGRLVGAPASVWASTHGAHVTVVGKDDDVVSATQRADIIITGAGVPGLIVPNMLKHGVVIFDAGTSEDGGKLAGDVHPSCADVASLMTPVPGGIGPIAVAKLFENLIVLAEEARSGLTRP